MNDSNPSARLAQKLFGLASKKYGAPYCGSPLIDDALSQGVRFWVSGIAVGGVGIPGMYVGSKVIIEKSRGGRFLWNRN